MYYLFCSFIESKSSLKWNLSLRQHVCRPALGLILIGTRRLESFQVLFEIPMVWVQIHDTRFVHLLVDVYLGIPIILQDDILRANVSGHKVKHISSILLFN